MKREIRTVDTERGITPLCAKCGALCPRGRKEGIRAWKSRKYCSAKCYGKAKDLTLPSERLCPVCGAVFAWPKGLSATQWRKRRYCSPHCARTTYSSIRHRQWSDPAYRDHMSKAHNPGQPNHHLLGIPRPERRGPNSSNWKGGITPLNRKIRTSLEYQLWRKAVFARDNYTCLWCGDRTRSGHRVVLHADHIKPFATHPDLRLDVSNGRTLCKPCHEKTETFSGRTRKPL